MHIRLGIRSVAVERRLCKELGIHSLLAAALVLRGYDDPAAAEVFLNPSVDQLHSPRLLPDFDAACAVLMSAIDQKSKIFVHGDYDVDGVTSTALFCRFLRRIGGQVTTFLPSRFDHGYGVHLDAVRDAAEQDASIFLTCDCGTGDYSQVAAASELGMKVVVTDHHQCGDLMPSAAAVVNPMRSGSKYPFSRLSGAGVAFKLCEGICAERHLNRTSFVRAFSDLAAVGTVADMMPLRDENRIITSLGLRGLGASNKVGIRALMTAAGVKVDPGASLRGEQISFYLGPRLNSAGRVSDPSASLRLLLTESPAEAAILARQLEAFNAERQRQESEATIEAMRNAEIEISTFHSFVIVLANENWSPGIIGLVAGRLTRHFNRPSVVLGGDPSSGVLKGSARSINGFDIGAALRGMGDLLLSGGGHAGAAGCSLRKEKLQAFKSYIDETARACLTEDDLVPTVTVDCEVRQDELMFDAVEELERLEPCGQDNPAPVFLIRALKILSLRVTREGAHALLTFDCGNVVLSGIGFRMAERFAEFSAGDLIDVIGQVQINRYNGEAKVQLKIAEFAAAGSVWLKATSAEASRI